MRSVRQELGQDYPIWFRINGSDFLPEGGFTLSDCKHVSKWMVKAGADAVSITAGTYESPIQMSIQPMFVKRGCLLPFSNAVKKSVKVPVIVAGRINTPELAEKALQAGKADFIAMGRELLVDPELPHKAAEGRLDEIRRCLSCNECIDRIRLTDPTYQISCTVNAMLGHEREYEIKRTARPKKVMVIGGGPAGMEAARIAAARGHKVTLFEKENRLGGQVIFAAQGPHKQGLNTLTKFLSGQLKKTGVTVRTRHEITPSQVQQESPDVVILAAGAVPLVPPISGISQKNVVTANDVLIGKASPGHSVIVIGGGRVGLEVAEVLAKKGTKVTIVEMLKRIGNDMGLSFRAPAIRTLRKLGVQMLASARAESLQDGALILDKEGEKIRIEADTIILAAGARSNNQLADLLKGKFDLHVVGDCARPRNILESIAEGARIARDI
jgi:2,4-dienoyl-CoA reductase (NADPH2)